MLGKTNVKVKPNKKVNYVEYIESTGTQYIDTGIPASIDLKVVADITPLDRWLSIWCNTCSKCTILWHAPWNF